MSRFTMRIKSMCVFECIWYICTHTRALARSRAPMVIIHSQWRRLVMPVFHWNIELDAGAISLYTFLPLICSGCAAYIHSNHLNDKEIHFRSHSNLMGAEPPMTIDERGKNCFKMVLQNGYRWNNIIGSMTVTKMKTTERKKIEKKCRSYF